jgi:hypothetical protein
MKRITDRTVVLTDREIAAHEQFEELLSRGIGLPLAAKLTLNRYFSPPALEDQPFADWLSDGTVQRWGGRWRVMPQWRWTGRPPRVN